MAHMGCIQPMEPYDLPRGSLNQLHTPVPAQAPHAACEAWARPSTQHRRLIQGMHYMCPAKLLLHASSGATPAWAILDPTHRTGPVGHEVHTVNPAPHSASKTHQFQGLLLIQDVGCMQQPRLPHCAASPTGPDEFDTFDLDLKSKFRFCKKNIYKKYFKQQNSNNFYPNFQPIVISTSCLYHMQYLQPSGSSKPALPCSHSQ